MCLNARARLLQGYKIGFQAQRGAMILSANSGGGGTGLNWVGDHNYFLRCWLLQYSARETTIGFVYVLRQKVRGATGIIVIALCTRKAIGGGRDGGPHTNRIIFTTQTIHSSTLLHNLWVILSARQAGRQCNIVFKAHSGQALLAVDGWLLRTWLRRIEIESRTIWASNKFQQHPK